MYHHDDSYYGSCDSCSGDSLNTTDGSATNSPRAIPRGPRKKRPQVNHGFLLGVHRHHAKARGTWNRRPSGVSTMWRLLNVVDTERPWTITGMAFYADEAQAKDV